MREYLDSNRPLGGRWVFWEGTIARHQKKVEKEVFYVVNQQFCKKKYSRKNQERPHRQQLWIAWLPMPPGAIVIRNTQ